MAVLGLAVTLANSQETDLLSLVSFLSLCTDLLFKLSLLFKWTRLIRCWDRIKHWWVRHKLSRGDSIERQAALLWCSLQKHFSPQGAAAMSKWSWVQVGCLIRVCFSCVYILIYSYLYMQWCRNPFKYRQVAWICNELKQKRKLM